MHTEQPHYTQTTAMMQSPQVTSLPRVNPIRHETPNRSRQGSVVVKSGTEKSGTAASVTRQVNSHPDRRLTDNGDHIYVEEKKTASQVQTPVDDFTEGEVVQKPVVTPKDHMRTFDGKSLPNDLGVELEAAAS